MFVQCKTENRSLVVLQAAVAEQVIRLIATRAVHGVMPALISTVPREAGDTKELVKESIRQPARCIADSLTMLAARLVTLRCSCMLLPPVGTLLQTRCNTGLTARKKSQQSES